MLLNQLLHNISINYKTLNKDLLNEIVTGITTNSNLVKTGYIFVAIKGYTTDGHLYLKEALNKGALILFVQKNNIEVVKKVLSVEELGRIIIVEDTKTIVKKLSKIFYNKLPANIIAVTGTNGKTSVSSMVVQILNYLGVYNAKIGTLGTYFNENRQKLGKELTTPVVEEIFFYLNEAKKNNIDYAVIEASSEGLDQNRLALLPVNIAAFTNLSQDHLNYHNNMENYFSSKCKLFTEVLKINGIAVINQDDYYGKRLINICKEANINTVTYGKKSNDLKLMETQFIDTGYNISILYKDIKYNMQLNILGDFQIYNLLCALLIVFNLKVSSISKILEAVKYIKDTPGRLELIKIYKEAKIFVDYAHTPDALERVLNSLRKITKNKLYVVFGCGGNRDTTKRKQMGSIANRLADFSFITDDNPRYEDPKNIRDEIILGYNTSNYISVDNREQAIIEAVKILQKGDVLLIAGKGHEEVQIIKDKTLNYSDKNVILQITNNEY